MLAAALWQHPHILILDELADYVDAPDMEALRCAVDRFGGGVILVTENAPGTSEAWRGLVRFDGPKYHAAFIQEIGQ